MNLTSNPCARSAAPSFRSMGSSEGAASNERMQKVFGSRSGAWLKEQNPRSWTAIEEPALRRPGRLDCRGCELGGCADEPYASAEALGIAQRRLAESAGTVILRLV